MEERIIDDEEGRLIKIKRTKNGVDAVEDTGENGAAEAEEVDEEIARLMVEFRDDDEYDEDLVGLTPTQLKEALERRERAKEEARGECDKYVALGDEALASGDFDEAEDNYESAVSYIDDDERANIGLWRARTKNFTSDEAYYDLSNARALSKAPQAVRDEVLSRDGEKLKAAREELLGRIAPLRAEVENKRLSLREPLVANRNYYRLRLIILLACVLCFAIAAGVSGYFTVRTTSIAPVVTAAIFGAGAGISLVLAVVYTRFYLLASRLCRGNEDQNATEEGRMLSELENREACLGRILGIEEESDGEAAD